MKRLQQLNRHNPPETYGDCDRTCVAMILGLTPDEVPHWFDENIVGSGWGMREEWLKRNGLVSIRIPMSVNGDPMLFVDEYMSGTPVMVVGKSPRGEWNHVVVRYDDTTLDPAFEQDGLDGPIFGAEYYLFEIFAPAELNHR